MSESTGPWDNNGLTQAQVQSLFSIFASSGVVANTENTLAVSAPGGAMQVAVNTGQAFLDGIWYHNDASKTLTVSTSDPSLPRIDRVVVHINITGRTGVVQMLTGTPNASPTPPALTQSSSVWEISLAQVAVAAGVTSISSGNVTDERSYAYAPNATITPAAAGARIFVQSATPTGANKYDLWFKLPFA